VAFANNLMRPPIFFGNAGASIATVVAFWAVFYIWISAEMYLGYRSAACPVARSSATTARNGG
jgi:hypothetical protein